MRRWLRRTLIIAAAVLGTPLALALLLYLLSDTGVGRWAITGIVDAVSDVSISDLDGTFPDALRAAKVEVADRNGVWLRLEQVDIDWKPWGWFSDNIRVARAHVGHATLLRLPVSDHISNAPDSLRFDVDSLQIDRADIDGSLTGHPVAIALKARGHWTNDGDTHFTLDGRQLGGRGTYHSVGRIDDREFTVTLDASEPSRGPLQSFAGLPELGPLAINARIWGPRSAENVDANVTAGTAKGRAWGGIDLVRRTALLDVSLKAQAMKPRADLSWNSIDFEGHVRGSFDAPEANGHLAVQELHAAGGGARALVGQLGSSNGVVRFDGTAEGVRIPARQANILASAPVKLVLTEQMRNKVPVVDISAEHPLARLRAGIVFAETTRIEGDTTLARVGPFADLAGVDLDGSATLHAKADISKDQTTLAVTGVVNGAGPALFSRLLVRGSRVAVAGNISPDGFSLSTARIDGAALTLEANGAAKSPALDIGWRGELHDASRLVDTLRGRLSLRGRLQGAADSFAATLTGSGSLATRGFAPGEVSVSANLNGLPRRISGEAQLRGQLDAAPVQLHARFTPEGSGTGVAIDSLAWRSIRASGDLALTGGFRLARLRADYHIGSLGDVALISGQAMRGAVHGTASLAPQGAALVAQVKADANGFGVPGFTAQGLAVDGRIADPFGRPEASLHVTARGMAVGGVTGDAQGTANGPLTALKLVLHGDLKQGSDELPVVTEATLDITAKKGTVARLETNYRGATFVLMAPAHVEFANGLAVDEARFSSGNAAIRIAGRLSPSLSAQIDVANASAGLVKIFVPSLDAEGTLSGNAKLTGAFDNPGGSFTLNATGFRMRGAASGLPPASVTASGTLHGRSATVSARIEAGKSAHLALDGTAPLANNGSFNLAVKGTLDLAVTDPVLAANGRRLRGIATIDGRFTGTFDNPRASGSARLTGGEFSDYLQGVRINDVAATIVARGDTIIIETFNGRAGRGTLSGSGSIALWADGIPLDLDINLVNASPLQTDQFNAALDASLKLAGKFSGRMTLSGTARVVRGEINIAESYPADVGVLDVRHSRNAPAPKPPPPRTSVNLDLRVNAPSRIFVRGRGLNAEVSGTIGVKGTSLDPLVTGAFTMRRGELALAGQTLNFTSGKVTFDGESLNGASDPALDFVAETSSGSVTAKLAITGHASAPHIALSSTPNLPQDEVLAHLLFSRSVGQLSPFELASLAQAFAQLGGLSGGFNPLSNLRRSLGLDRLAVGASANGNGATIEVGKNLSGNVYVGARQDTAGGTQAIVQVDLNEHLKLQSTVTAVPSAQATTGTQPKTDQGTSVGLSYQFEY